MARKEMLLPLAREFGLPVCDVIRDGAGPLVNAVLDLRKELHP